jgi:MFS transporter, ACS family, pantothenate transporter
MVTSAAQKPQHIMAIRFFQALFESSTFVGTHYILGSWVCKSIFGLWSILTDYCSTPKKSLANALESSLHQALQAP